MCLVAVWLASPHEAAEPTVLVVGNRDEEHARPTAPAAPWPEAPGVLAGRDMRAGGAWMGVTDAGRWAVLTNFRHPDARRDGASRGAIVRDFLIGRASAATYAATLAASVERYPSFNLLLGDDEGALSVADTRGDPGATEPARVRPLEPGLHVLSNARLGEAWPKTRRLAQAVLEEIPRGAGDEPLLAALADRRTASDAELPATGVPLPIERFLSASFLVDERYGTRASTLLRVGPREVSLFERSFDPGGQRIGDARWRLARGFPGRLG